MSTPRTGLLVLLAVVVAGVIVAGTLWGTAAALLPHSAEQGSSNGHAGGH